MSDSDFFDHIFQTFDPSFRYLIIGCDLQNRTLDVRRDIMDIFEKSGINVLEKTVYQDDKLDRQYVVLKLEPDLAKALHYEILYALMPNDIFWYFYEKKS